MINDTLTFTAREAFRGYYHTMCAVLIYFPKVLWFTNKHTHTQTVQKSLHTLMYVGRYIHSHESMDCCWLVSYASEVCNYP